MGADAGAAAETGVATAGTAMLPAATGAGAAADGGITSCTAVGMSGSTISGAFELPPQAGNSKANKPVATKLPVRVDAVKNTVWASKGCLNSRVQFTARAAADGYNAANAVLIIALVLAKPLRGAPR